jgi:hypothetical protein
MLRYVAETIVVEKIVVDKLKKMYIPMLLHEIAVEKIV